MQLSLFDSEKLDYPIGVCIQLKLSLIIFTTLIYSKTNADVCANNYSELNQTPALKSIQSLIENKKNNGFVNKTQGSYFFLQTQTEKFIISFYTTGLFDMFGVHKEGPIVFCDTGHELRAKGLGRNQKIFVHQSRLEFGNRTDRESFIRGPMPDPIAKINKVPIVTFASF